MADENIPEVVQEKRAQVESVFMRTVLRKDVYDRLKEIAKTYSTGQGHWDFGVAIQILLDFYEGSKLGLQGEKLDLILQAVMSEKQDTKPPEEETIEMLGGSTIPKKG